MNQGFKKSRAYCILFRYKKRITDKFFYADCFLTKHPIKTIHRKMKANGLHVSIA